ncbi:MAG: GDP-mannose 4,6-dehydratase [Candidatus Beckwithbacteria bacterium]|nr:GDP-mannose 4,6-dehydratase [Patescibacteria group bacterium]
MKTAFITGITGQDGSYLAEFLLAKDYKVIGLISHQHDIGFKNIESFKDKLILEEGDLLDKTSMLSIVKKHQPQEIYNLGGLTFAPASWDKPTLTLDINTLGVARLLEIIKENFNQTKFYQATSAKIFGIPSQTPQTESTPPNPIDPYSISKTTAHRLVKSMRQQFNLFAVSGILYNHESERRGVEFVTRKITHTAAKIKLGLTKELMLGNLEATQDWGYAPDYVKAMWLMLQQASPVDYIIASGELHSVKDVCQVAFSHLDLNYQDYVKIDKKFFRKTESQLILGDSTKAKQELNWQPEVTFEDMIIKMVENDLLLMRKLRTSRKVRNNSSNI